MLARDSSSLPVPWGKGIKLQALRGAEPEPSPPIPSWEIWLWAPPGLFPQLASPLARWLGIHSLFCAKELRMTLSLLPRPGVGSTAAPWGSRAPAGLETILTMSWDPQAWGEHHPKLVSEPRAGIRVLRCWNVQRKEQGARAELWLPVPAPTILHTQPMISLSEETPSPLGPASSQANPDIPIPTCTCAAWPRKRGKTQTLGHGKMISQK